jgi:hypothetical protein
MSKMISARIDEELLDRVERERAERAISWAQAVREALALWVEQRRLEEAARQHRERYERFPVGEDEFAPVLGAQQWPK